MRKEEKLWGGRERPHFRRDAKEGGWGREEDDTTPAAVICGHDREASSANRHEGEFSKPSSANRVQVLMT
jgi:hypothetical protein